MTEPRDDELDDELPTDDEGNDALPDEEPVEDDPTTSPQPDNEGGH